MCFDRKKRLEKKVRSLTGRLDNFDRINKGFHEEINESTAEMNSIKDESMKKRKSFALFGRRREQSGLEKKRSRITRELNKARNELARLK